MAIQSQSSKELARKYMQSRQAAPKPIQSIAEIREQLGWKLIPGNYPSERK